MKKITAIIDPQTGREITLAGCRLAAEILYAHIGATALEMYRSLGWKKEAALTPELLALLAREKYEHPATQSYCHKIVKLQNKAKPIPTVSLKQS